jgi:pilus assembly protein Flp/PilA
MRIMPRFDDKTSIDKTPIRKKIKQFIADQSGATSIEYALIAAGIALAIIAAVNTLGTTLSKKFTSINSSLK